MSLTYQILSDYYNHLQLFRTEFVFILICILLFRIEGGRVNLVKTNHNACKVSVAAATKADAGVWRCIITLAFRRTSLEHYHTNVTVTVDGKFFIVYQEK